MLGRRRASELPHRDPATLVDVDHAPIGPMENAAALKTAEPLVVVVGPRLGQYLRTKVCKPVEDDAGDHAAAVHGTGVLPFGPEMSDRHQCQEDVVLPIGRRSDTPMNGTLLVGKEVDQVADGEVGDTVGSHRPRSGCSEERAEVYGCNSRPVPRFKDLRREHLERRRLLFGADAESELDSARLGGEIHERPTPVVQQFA
jgi:hypothetical protein